MTSVSTVETTACQTVNHSDAAQRRVGDDVAERVEVEAAVGGEPPFEDRDDRPGEEDPEEHDRHRDEREPAAATASPVRVTAARCSSTASIQSSRCSPISSGGSVNGSGGTAANFVKTGRQRRAGPGREDEHLERHVGLEPLGEHEVEQLPAAPSRSARPRARPANSTWRKQVSVSTAVGASSRGGSA